jgi:hypothetical protein
MNIILALECSLEKAKKTKAQTILDEKQLRGFGPLANYADRATAASWQSSTNFCG